MGKIRYFFWSTAFSGCLLIYTVATGNLKKTMATVTAVRAQGAAGLPGTMKEKIPLFLHDYLPNVVKRKIPCHVWDNADQLSDRDFYPDPAASSCVESGAVALQTISTPTKMNGADVKKVTKDIAENGAPIPKRLADSVGANRDDLQSGNFVEIEGKYYKKTPDNIYDVNNTKVYFVNNHRYAGQDNSKNRVTTITHPRQVADSKDDDVAEGGGSVNLPAGDAANLENVPETPTTPAEMMQVLQKAQQNQQAEKQMLDAIDKGQ